jgi:hypothetical protein
MKHNRIPFVVLLAFVLGCFAGPMANQFVVRPAQAAPEGVRKWEQYCSYYATSGYITEGDLRSNVNPDLKNRGLEGWELVSAGPLGARSNMDTSGILYCFRRPIS